MKTNWNIEKLCEANKNNATAKLAIYTAGDAFPSVGFYPTAMRPGDTFAPFYAPRTITEVRPATGEEMDDFYRAARYVNEDVIRQEGE